MDGSVAATIYVDAKDWPGVESALVICGSDKRGSIYGIYDLSEEAGQSPWYYWADVPAKKHAQLYVKAGKFSVDANVSGVILTAGYMLWTVQRVFFGPEKAEQKSSHAQLLEQTSQQLAEHSLNWTQISLPRTRVRQ